MGDLHATRSAAEARHGESRGPVLRRSAARSETSHRAPTSARLDRACSCAGGCSACATGGSLKISQPGDRHEREADRMADEVMRGSTAPLRMGGSGAALQRQAVANGTNRLAGAPPVVNQTLSAAGKPLDGSTRRFMESRFGHDFSTVRVHASETAARSAQAVHALAYTVGHNVVFGRGQYAPGSSAGRRLLAHELTHVVQQSGQTTSDAGISRSPIRLQRQSCPPCITTGTHHPIDAPVQVGSTPARMVGAVVEMSVDPPTPYRDANWNGVRIFERVSVGGDCPAAGQNVSNTSAFIVGSRNQVPMLGTIFPAKRNVFYDNHLMVIGRGGGSCTSVRDQTYTCDDVDISRHRITTVINGTNPSTTTKTDVTRCIQEGSGR